MTWSTIDSTTIEVGDPVTAELFAAIKANDDDHESRLTTVETAVNTFRPIVFGVHGAYYPYIPADGVLHEDINFATTVLGAYLLVVDDGDSGTLTCDLEYKRGAGAWTSIFSTLPSVAQGGGDYVRSTNQVLTADIISNGLFDNDILRLNIDSAQLGNMEFQMVVEIEKA